MTNNDSSNVNKLQEQHEPPRNNTISRCQPHLGTLVELSLCAEMSEKDLLALSNTVFKEIARIHEAFSFHSHTSLLTELNARLIKVQAHKPSTLLLDKELAQLISFSLELWKLSYGLFDITVAPILVKLDHLPTPVMTSPTHFLKTTFGGSECLSMSGNRLTATGPVCIDLGGVAKGFAVDCGAKLIPKHVTYTINAGGDLATNKWQESFVGLKYGKRSGAVKKTKMLNSCVATSGSYLRDGQSVFVRPNTRGTLKFNGSMSVFASSAMVADALTKVGILCAKDTQARICEHFEARMVSLNRFGFRRKVGVDT